MILHDVHHKILNKIQLKQTCVIHIPVRAAQTRSQYRDLDARLDLDDLDDIDRCPQTIGWVPALHGKWWKWMHAKWHSKCCLDNKTASRLDCSQIARDWQLLVSDIDRNFIAEGWQEYLKWKITSFHVIILVNYYIPGNDVKLVRCCPGRWIVAMFACGWDCVRWKALCREGCSLLS